MWMVYFLLTGGAMVFAQEPNEAGALKQEELDQMLAPIALYPDSLLAQIFMASTYPLEVVQADKWGRDNNNLKGDEFAAALEARSWDPSVKSLVNFPDVLQMMAQNLDLTQKLGDAFLSQPKDVMNTVQKLRRKAQEQGNLKSSEQQVVTDSQQIITIEPNNPEAMYIPEYDPSLVYGDWWYPYFTPYERYQAKYGERPTPYTLRNRTEAGPAWGYAWGNCDWGNGALNIDVDRNSNLNQKINRNYYTKNYQQTGQFDQSGRGTWQHSPANRRGVAYSNQTTAQKFNRAPTTNAIQSREAYRGREEQRGQNIDRSGAGQQRQSIDRGAANRPESRQGVGQRSRADQRTASRDVSRDYSNRSGAFQGMDSGSAARNASNRGQMSRQTMPSQPMTPQSMPRPAMPRPGGFRGGGRR